MKSGAIYIAATAQHTGKTSASLGIVSGLQQILRDKIGFLKPVGQSSVQVPLKGKKIIVDKDVPLFKELFDAEGEYTNMSPVLIGKGYTRNYIKGHIAAASELLRIENSFSQIRNNSAAIVVEGTGHVAVGSSVGLSNAKVAAHLKTPMVLVVNGGIGKTLDEFALNAHFCQSQGATIGGVILNKVREDNLEDVRSYTGGALLSNFGIPLLGVVPDFVHASYPAVLDFEKLGMRLLAGQRYRASHRHVHAVLTGKSAFRDTLESDRAKGLKSLYMIHASRKDLLQELDAHLERLQTEGARRSRMPGILVVGCEVECESIAGHAKLNGLAELEPLERYGVPILSTSMSLEMVMDALKSYTAKLNVCDHARTRAVAQHYASHIDFEAMLDVMNFKNMVSQSSGEEETAIRRKAAYSF